MHILSFCTYSSEDNKKAAGLWEIRLHFFSSVYERNNLVSIII